MAYSRQNDRFYKDFTGSNGGLYRLIFQPSWNANTTGFNDVELPDGIINKESVNIKGSFENDMPIGMPQAKTMDISIDLRFFTGDFIDVGNWILEKFYSSTRIIFSGAGNEREISIPNRWILYKHDGTGYNIKRFDGLQDIKPQTTLPIKDDDYDYKFTCIGMNRGFLERLKITDLGDKITSLVRAGSALSTHDYVDLGNYDAGDRNYVMRFTGKGSLSWNVENISAFFSTMIQLANEIVNQGEELFEALVRENWQLDNNGEFYDNITFYKRSQDIANTRGAALAHNEIYFCPFIEDIYQVVYGGQLAIANDENTSNGGWAERYSNVWDLMKYMLEGSRQKVIFDINDPVASPINVYSINILKLFDGYSTHKSTTERTLTKSDYEFLNAGVLKQNEKVVSQTSVHWDSLGVNEINSLELESDGILSQNSFDSDLLLHNARITPDHVVKATGSTTYLYASLDPKYYWNRILPINRIYYDAGSFVSIVHDSCDIDYGDSITKSNNYAISNPIWSNGSSSLEEYYDRYKKLSNFATSSNSLCNLVGQSFLDLMSNVKQYIFECEVDSDLIDNNDLGNIFTIDIDEVKNNNIPLTYQKATTTCVLVGVEEKPTSESTKCKFFIRGVNSI